jgi:4-hydroxy-tetrahydrodipicolinate synthase
MAGTKGVIWGGANYMPHEAVRLYELVSAGQHGDALVLWKRMLPSLLFIWRMHYTPSVLRAAQLRGYGTGNVRRPLRKLTAEQDKALQEALAPLLDAAPSQIARSA